MAEPALEIWFGAAICESVLGLLEDWLKIEHREMSQEWQDKVSAAYQQVADENIGVVVRGPYVVLLVAYMEFAIVHRDDIRRKFKDEKLPDDPDASGASEMGPLSTGIRGDSGNRENPNS